MIGKGTEGRDKAAELLSIGIALHSDMWHCLSEEDFGGGSKMVLDNILYVSVNFSIFLKRGRSLEKPSPIWVLISIGLIDVSPQTYVGFCCFRYRKDARSSSSSTSRCTLQSEVGVARETLFSGGSSVKLGALPVGSDNISVDL